MVGSGSDRNHPGPSKTVCRSTIVEATRQAEELGVRVGDTGLEALAKLLAAE